MFAKFTKKGAASPEAPAPRERRQAVSAGAVTEEAMANWTAPYFEKTSEEKERIKNVITSKLGILFGHLNAKERESVIDAMEKKPIQKSTNLIKQGDDGDYFYIVEKGQFDIFVARGGKAPAKVAEAGPGGSFGELALMYNAPRAATVTALEDCIVWALDRDSFRMLLVTNENTKKNNYEDFIEKVPIFKSLNRYERGKLCDMLKTQNIANGGTIITQGDRGDRFYIIDTGGAVAKMKEGNSPEIEVKKYSRGDYFGEVALLSDEPRKASIYATTDNTVVLWVDKATFDRVLGPIKEQLLYVANKYPTYQDVSKA
eukprot:Platyproteum_vivax@DN4223_c0_g1_i1.p1